MSLAAQKMSLKHFESSRCQALGWTNLGSGLMRANSRNDGMNDCRVLVLPEEPDGLNERLGRWLKDQLQNRRNTVRFLLPRAGTSNAFYDRGSTDIGTRRDEGAGIGRTELGIPQAPDEISERTERHSEEAF